MPKKKDNIQIIGTQGGICGYVDRNQVVYRAQSSLTGKRTKIDPVFAGFRKSSNRMKEAVPVASALYRQLSREQKQFGLFRIMTGEAISMLKQGLDKTAIRETLFKRYIEPVLAGHEYKIPPTVMRRSRPPLPGYTCIGHVEGFPRLENMASTGCTGTGIGSTCRGLRRTRTNTVYAGTGPGCSGTGPGYIGKGTGSGIRQKL